MTPAKITIVVDNRAGGGLAAEHGLSLWIESGGKRTLFDTGQGPAMEENARRLGIDPASADNLVLSHGHYDHSGGVTQVLGRSGNARLYCHPAAVRPRFSVRDGVSRAIGMPERSAAAIHRLPAGRVHWVRRPATISDTLELSGPIPRDRPGDQPGGPFYLDRQATLADAVEDDLALRVRTPAGAVIVTGCCHTGLENTLRHFMRPQGDRRVRALVGGLHLLNADRPHLERIATVLRSMRVARVVPCHCTGDVAIDFLRDVLGDRVTTGAAGKTFLFGG